MDENEGMDNKLFAEAIFAAFKVLLTFSHNMI